jgi:small-conductance mechanosensitive channel
MTILMTGMFGVGDRIEINGRSGDVIDISILNTTLLEIRNWVDGDQATGRITSIPNGLILTQPVQNYTKDHDFIWDELTIPVTYDSDWKLVIKDVEKLVKQITGKHEKNAERDMNRIGRKYYLTKRITEPQTFVKLTDNWIQLSIRYIADTRTRRSIQNEISQNLLEYFNKNEQATIASETLDIIGFPKVSQRK